MAQVAAGIDPQAKHAINTKGAGGDIILPCPSPTNPGGVASSAGKHAINTKGMGANDRVILSGCDETVLLEPSMAFTIKWEPPQTDTRRPADDWIKNAYDKRIRVWQMVQGQMPSSAQQPDNLIVTWLSRKGYEYYRAATLRTVPCTAPYSCDFIWDIQAVDDAGKEIGERQIGRFRMSPDPAQMSNEKTKPYKGEKPNDYIKRISNYYDRVIKP